MKLKDQQQEKFCIGPLKLKRNIPTAILHRIRSGLQKHLEVVTNKNIQSLLLQNGKFNRHWQILETVENWIDKYQIESVCQLKCENNKLPILKKLTYFHLPRLQMLNLSNCQIQSLQYLLDCQFPNLHTLILCKVQLKKDNNHIMSLRPFRRCKIPFLSQLIMDSNNILEISSLYELRSAHLLHIELQNNKMVDVRSIFKLNCFNLNELRLENIEYTIFDHQDILIKFSPKKFPNL